MKNYNSSFLLAIAVIAYFISASLAVNKGKRKLDRPESSSAENKRLQSEDKSWMLSEGIDDNNINLDIVYRENTLELVKKISTFEEKCTSKTLKKFKGGDEKELDAEVTSFLEACDSQALEWLSNKISRLDEIGGLIVSWFEELMSVLTVLNTSRHNLLVFKTDIIEENIRWYHYRRRFQIDWLNRDGSFSKEQIDNSNRAYYFGEGLCVHILAQPFDRVETLIEVTLKEFPHIQYVKNLRDPLVEVPTILKIYIVQKLCRKFYDFPEKNETDESVILSPIQNIDAVDTQAAREIFEEFSKVIEKSKEENGYSCDWSQVYSHKQQHRILKRLKDDSDFLKFKNAAEDSLNSLVEQCLSAIKSGKDVDQIYERMKNPVTKELLSEALKLLRNTIKHYHLQPEASINDVLDVRSPSNELREILIETVNRENADLKLFGFFVDLLSGHIGDFHNGIFREPTYKNKNLEYQTLEFLTHVFNIKGYKPKQELESPLLDFYYLYKVSEICNMIQIKEFIDLKKRFEIGRTAVKLVNSINKFELDCNTDKLREFKLIDEENSKNKVIQFLGNCSLNSETLLMKKTSRLAKLGQAIDQWMSSIGVFLLDYPEKLKSMLFGDMRTNQRFKKRLQETWRLDRLKKIDSNREFVNHYKKFAYYFGGGLCIHILEPPFDKVEKFMEVVWNDFQHLNYFQDFGSSHLRTPVNIVIYIFQRICRNFYEKPTNPPKITKGNDFSEYLPTNILKHIAGNNLNQLKKPIYFPRVNLTKISTENDISEIITSILKYIAVQKYNCDNYELFNRKKHYDALYVLKGKTLFEELKQKLDESLDLHVKNCLLAMESDEQVQVDQIYERVKDTPYEEPLKTIVSQLWLTISFQELPIDQSMNDLLDIRSSRNEFKEVLMLMLEQNINDANSSFELVKLSADLMLGRLNHFEEGIFREPIYKNINELIENRSIEFLFNVFSIKGYKFDPEISNQLIDFYYLYKISESFHMIPINEVEFDLGGLK